ncbi:MAG: alpha/beta hydrolase [Firmicutes bacterium]|nr:alpha/beta hydrolase [Alicyclobacillaceae bacterium]MCL6496847.1 alpha/beta hydrolase [Bacillota bacterium]
MEEPRLELVRARSEDGYELEGAAWVPRSPKGPAYILIHGMAGRFYSRTLVELAQGLAGVGHPAVSGHTRGHDFGALMTRRGGGLALGGAAFEDVTEAPYDVGGWVDWAEARWPGCPLVLVGHSLGGFKVAVYQAWRQDPRVHGLVLLSPAWSGSPRFWPPDIFDQARAAEAASGPWTLLPVARSPVTPLSARTILSRVPAAWPRMLPDLVAEAAVPVLATYGSEADLGGWPELRALQAVGATVRWFGATDHHYRGAAEQVAFVIRRWWQSQAPEGSPTAAGTTNPKKEARDESPHR